MKAELEARIAQLKEQLAAEEQKLQRLVEDIPSEFHNLTREVFEKLKSLFE